MYRPSSWVLIFLVMGMACERPTPTRCTLSAEDLAAVRATQLEAVQALLAGDWNRAAAVHAEDAVRLPPGAGDERGRAAIQASLAQMAKPAGITLRHSEIAGCGDLAYAWTTFAVSWRSSGAEQPPAWTGREIVIYRKQSDGKWLASRVIFNSDKQ
jgi:ketosteroid isomerase-like protein